MQGPPQVRQRVAWHRLALARAGNALLYQAVAVIRIDQAHLRVLDGFAKFGVGNAVFLGKPDKPLALVDSRSLTAPLPVPQIQYVELCSIFQGRYIMEGLSDDGDQTLNLATEINGSFRALRQCS